MNKQSFNKLAVMCYRDINNCFVDMFCDDRLMDI